MKNRVERKFQYTKLSHLDDIARNIKYMADRGVLDHKYIVIFGVNPYTEHIIMTLNKLGFEANVVLDNDPKKTGQCCGNVKVFLPEFVLEESHENKVFMIASRHFDSMQKQLQSMGYSRKKQIFKITEVKKEKRFHVLPYGLRLMQAAGRYESCRRHFGRNTWLFLTKVRGLGDFYFIYGYLLTYVQKNKILNWHILVENQNAIAIGKLFEIANITVVEGRELQNLMDFGYIVGYQEAKMMCLHWSEKKGEVIVSLHKNMPDYDIPFNRTYEYAIFNERLTFTLPSYRPDVQKIVSEFQRHGLKEGRTVILASESNSLVCLDRKIWTSIIEKLKNEGFTVCTNIASEEESPLPGTVGFQFSIENSIVVSEMAGWFIGMRSGLCDVISNAKCRKVVLYTNSARLKNVEKVFSFQSMGVGKDICEICVNTIGDHDLADYIYKRMIEKKKDEYGF